VGYGGKVVRTGHMADVLNPEISGTADSRHGAGGMRSHPSIVRAGREMICTNCHSRAPAVGQTPSALGTAVAVSHPSPEKRRRMGHPDLREG